MDISSRIINGMLAATAGAIAAPLIKAPVGALGGSFYGTIGSTLNFPIINFFEFETLAPLEAYMTTLSATWALMNMGGVPISLKEIIVLDVSMRGLIIGLGLLKGSATQVAQAALGVFHNKKT
jgi:hypothetical protein